MSISMRGVCACGVLAVALTTGARTQAHGYAIKDLGVFAGGSWSTAVAINSSGQAVGSANFADGSYHAVLFSAGKLQDLGTFAGATVSSAAGMNNTGAVVGLGYLTNNVGWRALLRSNGTLTNLGTFCSQYIDEDGHPATYCGNSSAADVNDNGIVVGTADMLGGGTRGFIWQAGVKTKLGTLGGPSSTAASINNAGQIAGSADTAGGGRHAFLYTAGSGMRDLGTLSGGTTSSASAVNETGEVVGSSTSSVGLHAVLWSGGATRDLGTLPGIPGSVAFGVNGFGQVVGAGRAGTGYKRSVRAFVYSSGTMLDLTNLIVSNPGWVVIEARAINDAGTIVGIGRLGLGAQHAVLLTPF